MQYDVDNNHAGIPLTIPRQIFADDLFYDNTNAEYLQRIRNTWNKNRMKEICGEIITCPDCVTRFSTTEVVNMALDFHKVNAESDIQLPIHARRSDIATYHCYPYDYGVADIHPITFCIRPHT